MVITDWMRRLCIAFGLISCILPLLASPAHATSTFLLLGDCMAVASPESEGGEPWTAQLEPMLRARGYDVKVINAGKPADSSAGGRARVQWHLDTYKPDVVMIGLGSNDMARIMPPEVTKENLAYMLQLLQEQHIAAVLMQANATPAHDQAYATAFMDIFPQLAEEYHVPLYPNFFEILKGDPRYISADTITLTEAGAHKLASHLTDFLVEKHFFADSRPTSVSGD